MARGPPGSGPNRAGVGLPRRVDGRSGLAAILIAVWTHGRARPRRRARRRRSSSLVWLGAAGFGLVSAGAARCGRCSSGSGRAAAAAATTRWDDGLDPAAELRAPAAGRRRRLRTRSPILNTISGLRLPRPALHGRIATGSYVVNDTMMKLATEGLPPYEVLMLRGVCGGRLGPAAGARCSATAGSCR